VKRKTPPATTDSRAKYAEAHETDPDNNQIPILYQVPTAQNRYGPDMSL
jgi:hypothetical protein